MRRFDPKWYARIDSTCRLTCFSWCLINFSSSRHHRTSSLAMPTVTIELCFLDTSWTTALFHPIPFAWGNVCQCCHIPELLLHSSSHTCMSRLRVHAIIFVTRVIQHIGKYLSNKWFLKSMICTNGDRKTYWSHQSNKTSLRSLGRLLVHVMISFQNLSWGQRPSALNVPWSDNTRRSWHHEVGWATNIMQKSGYLPEYRHTLSKQC